MVNLFDMHCHILPGVDDGSRDMDTTRKMLARAYEQGIRNMVATPHFMMGEDNTPVPELVKIFLKVRQEANAIAPDFNIFLGNELLYDSGLLEQVKKGNALTINGTRYVLIEFLVETEYENICAAVREFTTAGYIPVIAHVERYMKLTKHMGYIGELIDMGALIQVNISSLEGGITDQVTGFCRKLLKADMIHVFGTDAHGVNVRPPIVSSGLRYIEKKYGKGKVEELFNRNPKRILNDKLI